MVALVELTARFDEEANITWAAELEKAGVHVVYGVVGLKTHAKATLVVRRTGTGIRRYCHMGTGNYNSKTARLYEDIGLLSSDAELGEDLTDLFNYLTGYSRQRQYRRLLVAPVTLRSGMVELIRTQTHATAGSSSSATTSSIPRSSRRSTRRRAQGRASTSSCAARAGCALGSRACPRTSGCARSVGRYLEHSRIYHFGDDRWYIGSADLMGRNLDGRIETVVPVIDPRLQARLAEIVEVLLADDVLASELTRGRELAQGADGSRARRPGGAAQARGRARRAVTGPAGIEPGRGLRLEVPITFSPAPLDDIDASAAVIAEPVRRLRTTHWDTADLRLARWGVALEYSADPGWVLRLPATSEGMAAPDGAELQFDGGPERPPEAALAPRPRLRAPARRSSSSPAW